MISNANEFQSLAALLGGNQSNKPSTPNNNFHAFTPGAIGKGANIAQIKEPEKKNDDIWDEDDIEEHFDQDPRIEPEYSMNYRQNVSSEDLFLGMSGKTPSFCHSDELTVVVNLPDTVLKDINVDVKSSTLEVMTPK